MTEAHDIKKNIMPCAEVIIHYNNRKITLKEARHINWEKRNVNKQVHHVNLTLTL